MSFNLSSTPFSPSSLWNQQVNTGASYTSINWPTATGWNYGVATSSPPVYVASSSDPVVQVSVPASWGWPGGTVSVHVPAGATGGAGSDAPFLVVDGDTVYNFWQFDRTGNTTATAQAYGEANVVTGTGWGSSGQGAGIVAVGASELGGLLVQAQTDTGTIDHALQLAVQGSLLKSGYVAPAIAGDGTSSSGVVQEGQLLAISPGTPMPSGLSPLGQEVFRALQQYGAYVTDNGGGWTALRYQANAYDATTISALSTDVNKFLPLLKAVSGGTPTSSSSTSSTTSSTTTPTVTPAVTQVTASPATGIEQAGNTIALSLAFNEAVTVTGTPTLSLNDGDIATYVGGSGTGTLTFKTTVASTDTTTSALAITGVNLPSGASIKDASGVAANLSGAVTTFTGLAIDPPTGGSTSATKPVLTIADNSLTVAGRGGTVDLGTNVTTTDSNDVVTVNITGLPKYETITDKLDGRTFRGNNITLTAAQVDSGLTLTSNYRGGGHPTATLTLTASAKDPTTGAVSTASPQTITVVDPRPVATTTTTTSQTTTATETHAISASTGGLADQDLSGQHQGSVVGTGAASAPQPIGPSDHASAIAARVTSLAGQDLAGHGSALFSQIKDLIGGGGVATHVPQPTSVADFRSSTGTSTASLASQSFALLNQYLASHSGQVDAGQIVAAVSHATGWGQESLLARPQH